MEFLYEYALFLARAITVVAAVLVIVAGLVAIGSRQRAVQHEGHIEIRKVNERYRAMGDALRSAVDDPADVKARQKAEKKAEKQLARAGKKSRRKGADTPGETRRKRLYVMDFDGDLRASATDSLREEISVVLSQAGEGDEVLLRVESPGGLVHGYGLAASQLRRIRDAGVPLTVAVDKVAASGGYMMACVGDRILAAPFAVLGSIGVLAQLPNFHRLLKKHEIDFELMTAGLYKRTLTVFGENTEEGRAKFLQELEETHDLFKAFVSENRPSLNIDKVATGEVWYGSQALAEGLIDEVKTSDALVQERLADWDVFAVKFVHKKNWQEKLGLAAEGTLTRLAMRLWQRDQGPHY
ncbi:MAG: protease SohB [Halioglobus sp.]